MSKEQPDYMKDQVHQVKRPEGLGNDLSQVGIDVTISGHGPERVLQFFKKRIVIGAVASADIRLTGEGVSPIHAILEVDGSHIALYDLASDTGTFYQDEKIITEKIELHEKTSIGVVVGRNNLSIKKFSRLKDPENTRPLILVDEKDAEEIFDYRPTQKKAVEVVFSWYSTILDVEHFVARNQVSIGRLKTCDFGIPPLLGQASYNLITRKGSETYFHLHPKMRGVMSKEGSLKTLDAIRTEYRALTDDGVPVLLSEQDFVKIQIGGLEFYISFTAAPPVLKRRTILGKDPLFFRIFATSLLLTGVLLFAVKKMEVNPPIDAEKIPDRVATILYQPEKFQNKVKTKSEIKEIEKKFQEQKVAKINVKAPEKKAEQPKPKMTLSNKTEIPKQESKGGAPVQLAQNKAQEGEGARAKGKEGMRGKPNAPKVQGVEAQTKATRPSPNKGESGGQGNSQIVGQGNVDILKGAQGTIENILGNSALNIGKGGSKLEGFGGFTTEGKGGQGLSGDGKGGGGTAEGLGGLGSKGIGGGRVGTGLGASGTGQGMVGGKSRVAIRTGGPEETVVMGSIDADAVEAALLAHKDEFRLCYEREINANQPKLSGRVGTSFVIGSSGRVTQAGIESSSLKSPEVERCILQVIRRIDFPIPRGAGVVQVTYPFKFTAQGK